MCALRSSEGHHAALRPSSSFLQTSEDEEMGQRPLTSVPRRSSLTHRLLGLQGCARRITPSRRRMRQMTPEEKKDASYWDKRRKNNEAAKRSRERRRLSDFMLEGQLLALSEENTKLRTEMLWLQCRFGVAKDGQPAQAPLHNLAPAALKSSFWGFGTNPGSLLGEQKDLGDLLQGSRVSWTGASTSNGIGQNFQNPESHPMYMAGSSGQPYYLQPHSHSRKRACLQPYEKTLQHPYSRTGGEEPDSTANYQLCSSKENPGAPEPQPSSKLSPVLPHQAPPSFSASSHLPQSRFLPSLNNPSLCSSLVLPWGNPNLHLSPIYYNLPFYLPLEGRELLNHSLKTRGDAFSAELAHLRRYFLSESC
ncbi:NFIL3 like protein [Brienomyrus brachyistius]|uniref:NFIL3 like protein n=1 Tax=Brienomyrus brachyistius TaxID=42636 RepID=UPI0020B452F9|nr:NFIL3 like protein [Brienomyrus brachyistius]